MRVVRLGTRGSALARWQTDHIAARLTALQPDLHVEIVEIVSRGDQVLDVPLSQVEGTGFFTSTLERALTAGEIDVAVHSYKDLPVARTPGLTVAAVPRRGPVEEALCARRGRTLATLPRGATVGTCSTRRTAQVKRLRPDLTIVPLRGNVPTRVDRAIKGDLDAVVLAYAGLFRLGLTRHVTEVFSTRQMLPAPAQGALAVQCRVADRGLRLLLGRLDHRRTRDAAAAERRVLSVLGGAAPPPSPPCARAPAAGSCCGHGFSKWKPGRCCPRASKARIRRRWDRRRHGNCARRVPVPGWRRGRPPPACSARQ